jgi:hypothetical protein
MNKLSAFLGWTAFWGYAQVRVAETWPDREKFLKLVGKQSEDTKPLSWSNWVRLAEVKDGRRRGRLVGLAKKKGWAAVKLELKRDDGDLQSNDKADDGKPNAKVSNPLQAATQNVSAQVGTLKAGLARLVKELPAKITKAKPAELDSAVDELRPARKELGELCDALDECIGQLEQRQKLEAKKRAKGKSRKATAGATPRAAQPKHQTAA